MRIRFVGGVIVLIVLSGTLALAADPAPAEDSAAAGLGQPAESLTDAKIEDYNQWKLALGSGAVADPVRISALPGFQVELVRAALTNEGSWISLAFDPQGRAVIGREDRGLLRMTLADDRRSVAKVETIDDTLLECRGLLFAHGALYADANNSKGLYRLRDTDGDDRFDQVELLKSLPGGVGHGRNGLALGPDGMIYLALGNNVQVPADASADSPYRNYGLDRLLPCVWNEFLFDADVVPPAGFIARTDADGRRWEVIAGGFRNPYSVAFNPDGELFTYDADMEWDQRAPWYRATRVMHVVSGGEYGWRQGTSVWPDHFEDMLPGVVDIGLGSPTGVKFGTASHFPERYRQACYILDWAYGRIIAVHLRPQGASYAGQSETFLKGQPLNVTDLDFGPDGAMYFVVGGRGTQAALYKVRFAGENQDAPDKVALQTAVPQEGLADLTPRDERRALEQVSPSAGPEAIDRLWRQLGSSDRWLRTAARNALERQPVATWQARTLAEPQHLAAVTACLALARSELTGLQPKLLARLNELFSQSLGPVERLVGLRAYELAMMRMGQPAAAEMAGVRQAIEPLYPAPTWAENQLLCELLVYLNSASVVPKSLDLLNAAKTQEQQLYYLYTLRLVDHDWTLDDRRRYFAWLKRAESFQGARNIRPSVTFIRTDVLATLGSEERTQLAEVIAGLGRSAAAVQPTVARAFVQDWNLDELQADLPTVSHGRDFARGKAMFTQALCSRCHQFGDQGTAVGPDLAAVGARFSRRDVLESILVPSKVVEEKYRDLVFETDDGLRVAGQIAGGDRQSLAIASDPTEPTKLTWIARDSIVSRGTSALSIMPTGLLNTLSREEIFDLLAYLESGGNPEHPDFQSAAAVREK